MAPINYHIEKRWQEGNNAIMKTDRQVRMKPGRQRFKMYVREQYLRCDVPCQSELCSEDCKNDGAKALLSSTVTHYLVPCSDVLGRYIEIFEYSHLIGILFTQSVVSKCLHEFGKRHYKKICSKIKDKSNQCIYFPNEFSFYTYCQRKTNESCDDWQFRNIYNATVWYYNHLSGNMPFVIVTDNKQIIDEYQNQTGGVFVLNLAEYLTSFWPQLTVLHELYYSLNASLSSSSASSNGDKDYDDHLPQELLTAGQMSGQYQIGKLNVNKYHAQSEAIASISNSDTKSLSNDVLIVGMKNRNRAVHGDVVYVEIFPRSEWKGRIRVLSNNNSENDGDESDKFGDPIPTGRIVGIERRCWRNYVATFPVDDENSAQRRPGEAVLVIPYDYRIPKIRIVTRQPESLLNQRIVVRIDSWNLGSQYPNGHFVQSLGPIGDPQTETSVLLIENGITTSPFPTGVLSEMPSASWCPSASEIESRRDLRSTHLVFSIDPEGCEDVDDAMSIRHLPNGHLELGVHIADVAYFVTPGSLTDSEARSRGSTVYLADTRFDMLPRILNSNVCSLLRHVDRFAVSVFWELNRNYEVRAVEFGRTVINSSYQLTYEAAEDIMKCSKYEDLTERIPELESVDDLENRYARLRDCVLELTEIGRTLKWRRMQVGALELESVEVRVTFKDQAERQLDDITPKQHLESHETVAEMMIFANQCVAKKIHDNFPRQSLLRRHPAPNIEYFKDLISCARVKGFTIDTSGNKALAQSLDRSVDAHDPVTNNLLRQLATHAMSSAEYFSPGTTSSKSMSHYGLGLDFYTHFTSPIRRYADLVVHRLLLASIELNRDTLHLLSGEDLEDLCQHINAIHKASQDVQKSSQQFFQVLYFDNRDETDRTLADGVIFSIRSNGFLVYVPRYGIKGPVYLINKERQIAFVVDGVARWTEGSVNNDSSSVRVQTHLGSQEYKLFDHVTVRIGVIRSHAHAHSLKLELVENCPLVTDVRWEQQQQQPTKCAFQGDYNLSRNSNSATDINNSAWTPGQLNNSLLYKVFISLRELSLNANDEKIS